MSNQIESLLSRALTDNAYRLTPEIQHHLVQFLDLLQRWNKVFNLTAITDPKDMVYLHILDSLAISPHLQGTRILDVGTGAGLPGIPLALIHPEKEFVLLDSNSKKTRFLIQVIAALGLKNVQVVHARCEDFQGQKEGFDSIVSRAFSAIAVMLANTQHLIADGGQFLAMKGTYPEEEIQDIPKDFMVLGVHKLIIQGLTAERHLVCIQRK